MEKVQFQQEQMLAELKDLVEKGLFTQPEIRQIMKKRTAFEMALVRRVAKKGDFLRYAAYEMGLETLRKKRVERLNIPSGPPSISDYALVRRQFYIFERALKKFKADVGLWVQYIEVAKRENARALVGRITARALQLHPNTPALYILAASHELEHLSPSAARTLLQRGIRLNADSVDMWREYVKMELGFIESLRRRWDLLGIKLDTKGKGKEVSPSPEDNEPIASVSEHMQVDEDEGEGDAARLEIMNGAIVKSVISSAAKALPKIELFKSIQTLISTYPSPEPLREALLAHLHGELKTALPGSADAVTLHATRGLAKDPSGTALVDALKTANEELLAAAITQAQNHDPSHAHNLSDAYAAFVLDWCAKRIDDHLKTYLAASLHGLIRKLRAPAPALLAAHIRLLIPITTATSSMSPSPEKIIRTARKYTALRPRDAALWLARLDAEAAFGSPEDARKAWAEARAKADGERMNDVWMWSVAPARRISGPDSVENRIVLEGLLKESMRDSALRDVHEALLLRYAATQLASADPARVRRIATDYLPSSSVWAAVFRAVAESAVEGRQETLHAVYEFWKEADGLEAALAWGAWLLRAGQGRAAKNVVVRVRGMLSAEDGGVLDRRWVAAIGAPRAPEMESEE